jgi:plastocyanin
VTAKPLKLRQDVVVFVEKVEGRKFEAPSKPAVMDQKNLTFIPHVLPVMVGTVVEFRNSDTVLHNVFTSDKCAGKFNLGTWPKGQSRTYKFETAGCTAVMLCNVHPEMEAFVLALETPYFAVTDRSGRYAISDVPAGTYQLRVWSEKLKAAPQEIAVAEKDSVEANFTLGR